MIPSRNFAVTLTAFFLCLMALNLQAQEEPTPMYLQKKGGEGEGKGDIDTIYTGKVIAYGELLQPPYIVELKRDTIWINEISVGPRVKTFEEEPRVFEISAYDSMKFVRDTSIIGDFKRFVPLYGDSKTMDLLRAKYLPDTIVADLEFELKGKYVELVRIKFTDGTEDNCTGFGDRDENGEFVFHRRGHFTKEESMKLKRSSFGGIRNYLRDGGLLIFSLAGDMWLRPGDEMNLIMDSLRRVAKGELGVEGVREMYPRKALFRRESFWKEFQSKEDSWKK